MSTAYFQTAAKPSARRAWPTWAGVFANCVKSAGEATATFNLNLSKSANVMVVAVMAPVAHTPRQDPQSMQSSGITVALPFLTRMARVGQARMQAMQPSHFSGTIRNPCVSSFMRSEEHTSELQSRLHLV